MRSCLKQTIKRGGEHGKGFAPTNTIPGTLTITGPFERREGALVVKVPLYSGWSHYGSDNSNASYRTGGHVTTQDSHQGPLVPRQTEMVTM